jgi:hypothetical protein
MKTGLHDAAEAGINQRMVRIKKMTLSNGASNSPPKHLKPGLSPSCVRSWLSAICHNLERTAPFNERIGLFASVEYQS